MTAHSEFAQESRTFLLPAMLAMGLMASVRGVSATEPLHQRIDSMIVSAAGEPLAPVASDAHFVRRIFLDLVGRIPSVDETRDFLADSSETKREQLIDKLLADPLYARRMSELFNVLLMERRGTHSDWEAYLRGCFEDNRPWSQIAKEILRPDEASDAGTAFFYTKRLEKYGQNPTDYPGLTRDVGRLFMGVDLQCAQCHDHLTINEYEQLDFQGLFAVYQSLNIDKKSEVPAIIEKPMESKHQFASVFIGETHETGPRVPFGREFEIPLGDGGEPNESPLSLITDEICRADNPFFVRNFVNRLWFFTMGRGLVHPLDEHHSANPPSHPELLELLATEFAANGSDIKWLLRELVLSQTYQQTSEQAPGKPAPPEVEFRLAIERPLSPEQMLWSTFEAIGETERLSDAVTLEEHRTLFVKTFGNEAGEPEIDFAPSVKAALFLSNDDRFLKLLESQPGNLTHRLMAAATPEIFQEELFLSVLSRLPTDDEQQIVADAMNGYAEPNEEIVRYLVWSLLTSTEFRLNR